MQAGRLRYFAPRRTNRLATVFQESFEFVPAKTSVNAEPSALSHFAGKVGAVVLVALSGPHAG